MSNTATIESSVFVQKGSYVLGKAVVKGESVILEESIVKDTAKVIDSMVCGKSMICGKAQVVGSTVRGGSKIDEIASLLNSEVDGTEVKRFSKVVGSSLKGGWCQGDVWDSQLENCKVLGRIVKNEKR